VTEVRFPLFFARHEFRPDSGGDGRYRGGPGSILELHAEIAEPARANTAGDGTRHAPYGILGGQDGLPHRYRLRSRGRRDRVLRTKEVGVVVRPGDVFLVESGGGGGYGDPRQRTAEARAYDRENGFVTRGPARGAARRRAATRKAR
jgi:N-methylhydantoinase B